MAQQHIWTGLDADVLLYLSNAAGERVNAAGTPWVDSDGTILQYCFFQGATLTGDITYSRRPVTGRPTRRILESTLFEPELTVTYFFLSKSSQINLSQIFNKEQYLEVILRFTSHRDASDVEPHTLKLAKAVQFQITAEDNRNAQGQAKFVGEGYE